MPTVKRLQIAAMNIPYRMCTLEYFLDTQQALGVKSIELYGGSPHVTLSFDVVSDWKAVREAVESRGMKVIAFTPESATYQYLLCTENPLVREKSFLYFANAVKAAKELGAKLVPVSCAGGLKDHDPGIAYFNAVESLRRLAPIAEELGVTIAVETMCPDASVVINTLPELKKLLADVNSPNVKPCIDVCAMRTAGETFDEWFDAFGGDIAHIHFTAGRPAGRLYWGQGLHPLDDYLQTLNDRGYTGYLGLNINNRGNWFDWDKLTEQGWTGDGFYPENYWFNPAAIDRKNWEAFAPYLTD